MRGMLLVERENTDGDRRVIAQYDGEDRDGLDQAKQRADAALGEDAYAVRVLLDTGDTLRVVYRNRLKP